MVFQDSPRPHGSDPSAQKVAFYETPGPRPREFFLYSPAQRISGGPLLVSVHGIARNAAAHAYRMIEQAERYGVPVLAPLFSKRHYGQYQQLIDPNTGARSDLALLDMVGAAARLTGADTSRLLMFGYSGGAQFVHRFAMAHPHRVASAVLAAAGWYTFPHFNASYPLGLRDENSEFEFDLNQIAKIPFHVVVGELDTVRDSSLRRSRQIDRRQGRTRVDRALAWTQAMNAFAASVHSDARVSFSVLPAVGHSFTEATEVADLPRLALDRLTTDARWPPVEASQ